MKKIIIPIVIVAGVACAAAATVTGIILTGIKLSYQIIWGDERI